LSDLFGLTLSQGGLMNLVQRAQGRFADGRARAVAALRRAASVASDETGVRIEGSNAYHWVFRSPEAVVHHASPTRAASVVREMRDGHRPAVWLSDCYTAQQGHGRLQLWLNAAFGLSGQVTPLAASTSQPSAGPWSGN
jgi:transposase